VDRPLLHRHGGFLDGLAQRRVGVAGARDVLGRFGEFHRDGGFGVPAVGVGPDDVHAEHAVGLGVGEDFDETVGLMVDLGAAVGGEREFSRVLGDAGLFEVFLAFAD